MILAILQARMSSSRLPGKVLEPILDAPLILRALERIDRAETLDRVVLATSTDRSDDALVSVAEEAGVLVRRGSLNDVLQRFLTVIEEFEPHTVVRLTGDNALTDPAIIDRVVREHVGREVDYTSNTMERTFPRGLDVEVVRCSALRSLLSFDLHDEEREHVTMGVYRRPDRFRLHEVTQRPDRSDLRWTVDYPEDLAFARTVYAELYPGNPEFGQDDILRLIDRRPELRRTEADASH